MVDLAGYRSFEHLHFLGQSVNEFDLEFVDRYKVVHVGHAELLVFLHALRTNEDQLVLETHVDELDPFVMHRTEDVA